MRTIQFRAKVKKTRAENSIGKKPDDGTWVTGDLHYYNTGHPHIHYDLNNHRISVDVDTIGQYTGMYDSNGKQIWEGDIIKATNIEDNPNLGKELLGYVGYDEEIAAFILKHPDGKHGGTLYKNNACAVLEVVGNIYDSPELLNKDKR